MNFMFQVKFKRQGTLEVTGFLVRSDALALPFFPDHDLQTFKILGKISQCSLGTF